MFASEGDRESQSVGLQAGESTDYILVSAFPLEVEKLRRNEANRLADYVGGSSHLLLFVKVLIKQKMPRNSLIVGGLNFPQWLKCCRFASVAFSESLFISLINIY